MLWYKCRCPVTVILSRLDAKMNPYALCDATALNTPSHPQRTREHNISSHRPLLHNTAAPVLEINLLPVYKDEVHLVAHNNGPHEAFKMMDLLVNR